MLYPLFANLQGKKCVIIGAGALAEKRVEALLRSNASIRLVAPQATPVLKQLASVGSISWMRSLYYPAHLEGAFLVIAATDLREINQAVTRDASERNMLVCCADDPQLGNYLTGASIDRGGLQISLTTSGASPTLTSVLRTHLEKKFGEEWSDWIDLFASIRTDLQRLPSDNLRRNVVEEILTESYINELILSGDKDTAEEAAKQCILSHLD